MSEQGLEINKDITKLLKSLKTFEDKTRKEIIKNITDNQKEIPEGFLNYLDSKKSSSTFLEESKDTDDEKEF